MEKRERSRFIWIVLVSLVFLVLIVVAASAVFTVESTDRIYQESKEQLLLSTMEQLIKGVSGMGNLMKHSKLMRAVTEGAEGQYFIMMEIKEEVLKALYDPLYYAIFTEESVLLSSDANEEGQVPNESLTAVESKSEIVDEFRGARGHFIDLIIQAGKDVSIAIVIDRTEDIKAMKAFLDEENNNNLKAYGYLIIVLVVLSLMIILMIIIPANRRLLMNPVDELIEASTLIMQGKHDFEVKVDEASDYYQMQLFVETARKALEKREDYEESI